MQKVGFHAEMVVLCIKIFLSISMYLESNVILYIS